MIQYQQQCDSDQDVKTVSCVILLFICVKIWRSVRGCVGVRLSIDEPEFDDYCHSTPIAGTGYGIEAKFVPVLQKKSHLGSWHI